MDRSSQLTPVSAETVRGSRGVTRRADFRALLTPKRLGRRCADGVVCLALVAGGVSFVAPALTGSVLAGAQTSAPLAPTSVTAAQNGTLPDVVVTWSPPTTGSVPTGAVVQLYNLPNGSFANASYLASITCGSSCGSVVFRELSFASTYAALVWPTDAAGIGTPAASTAVTLKTSCGYGACVTVDATAPTGAATHAASGLLNSFYPVGNNVADARRLNTTMFRGCPVVHSDGSLDWSSWNAAMAAGIPTTLMLSGLWGAANPANRVTPWSDWAAYAAWVRSTVTAVLASGERVDYWDVYNEPGSSVGYYTPADQATVTPALLLQQFLVSYQAIKSVAPQAAIVGPSLVHWSDYPGQYPGDPAFDMATFLDFAVANNLQLAAISWHFIDDNAGPNSQVNTLAPANLIDQVAEARRLIAARPALGNPKIFINEYGMPEVQNIPGWDVGYLAALTAAHVDSANRSCWSMDCANPTLDGLLGLDGIATNPVYWVRTFYAAMVGNMVNTTSTADTMSVVGSFNPSNNTVTGLVGRGQGCNQVLWCLSTWPGIQLAAPTSLSISVTVPWSASKVRVAMSQVSGASLVPTGPPTPVISSTSSSPAGTRKSTVSLTIPAFADGDAYSFTITHS
jgi:hypothetical protein